MDKNELDIFLRQIRLEERIVGEKDNHSMKDSKVLLDIMRLNGQPSKEILISPHGRFRPTPRHTHDYLEIMYLYDGSIIQRWDGGSVALSPGDFFFIPPGLYHATDICGAGDIAVNLILSESLMYRDEFSLLMKRISPDRPYLIKAGNGCANESVCRLMEELLDPGEYSSEAIERVFSLLVLDLARADMAEGNELHSQEDLSRQDILYRIIRYIENDYRNVTLSGTAARFGYTPNYLSALLKKELGQSFSDFRRSFCMAQAALLLRESDLPVTEVASQSGFTNMTHFYKLFSRTFGITPGEYRLLNAVPGLFEEGNEEEVKSCSI